MTVIYTQKEREWAEQARLARTPQMPTIEDHQRAMRAGTFIGILLAVAAILIVLVVTAKADPRTECAPGPCKILKITPDEEKALVGQNMILDTAVAGRAIDLVGLVTYFRNKIATAPMGDVPALSGSRDETPKEKKK